MRPRQESDAAMIDPILTTEPPEPPIPDASEGYGIEVSARVKNLPPYLFGKINDLKYRKRRAGHRRHRPGHGQPDRPARPVDHRQALRGGARLENHRYSVASGVHNLRREVATRYKARFDVDLDPDHEVVVTIGSKEGFSHMCLALLGPGDTALVPAPTFPIHSHAVALADANAIALDVSDPKAFLANVAHMCEVLQPKPRVLDPELPAQPLGGGRRARRSSRRSWRWPSGSASW